MEIADVFIEFLASLGFQVCALYRYVMFSA